MFVSEYVHICVCKCICLLCVCVCVKMKDKHPVKHFHAGHVFVRMFLVWLVGKECVCVCVCVWVPVCVLTVQVCAPVYLYVQARLFAKPLFPSSGRFTSTHQGDRLKHYVKMHRRPQTKQAGG